MPKVAAKNKKLKMEESVDENENEKIIEENSDGDSETENEEKKRKVPTPKKVSKKPAGKKSAAKKKKDEEEEKEESDEEDSTELEEVSGEGSASVDASTSTTLNEPKVSDKQIKIISWNVAGFRSVLKKGFYDYVVAENPDVLCLQETKVKPSDVKKDSIPKGYEYHFIAADQPGHHGTALLTKLKPISLKFGIGIKKHDNEGRVITAEFDGFYLVNTYIPNSGARGLQKLDYRTKEWDVDFQNYLMELDKTKPVVWCGDLNVAHTEIDLKNPKTNTKSAGFTIEERTSFGNFLNKGFIDSYRHYNPGKVGAYTFWSYMGGARAKNVGWRLDYFIVSKRFIDSIKTPFIRSSIMGSDHCPIGIIVDV